jgi:glucosaminylphosphatidylinositol acyltransferase
VLAAALWFAYTIFAHGVQPTSRRLSNGAYVAWVLASALSLLLAFGAVDLIAPVVPSASILNAMNRHQLPTFIIANLLTGAVNLSVDTMHAPGVQARVILLAYIAVVAVVPLVLEFRRSRGQATSAREGRRKAL